MLCLSKTNMSYFYGAVCGFYALDPLLIIGEQRGAQRGCVTPLGPQTPRLLLFPRVPGCKLPEDGAGSPWQRLTKSSADSGDSIQGLSRGQAGPWGRGNSRAEVTRLDLALYLRSNLRGMEPFPRAAPSPESEAGYTG